MESEGWRPLPLPSRRQVPQAGGGAWGASAGLGAFLLALPGAASAQLVRDSPLLYGVLCFCAVSTRLSWGWGGGGWLAPRSSYPALWEESRWRMCRVIMGSSGPGCFSRETRAPMSAQPPDSLDFLGARHVTGPPIWIRGKVWLGGPRNCIPPVLCPLGIMDTLYPPGPQEVEVGRWVYPVPLWE